jgi:hypothetical protein
MLYIVRIVIITHSNHSSLETKVLQTHMHVHPHTQSRQFQRITHHIILLENSVFLSHSDRVALQWTWWHGWYIYIQELILLFQPPFNLSPQSSCKYKSQSTIHHYGLFSPVTDSRSHLNAISPCYYFMNTKTVTYSIIYISVFYHVTSVISYLSTNRTNHSKKKLTLLFSSKVPAE